MQRNATSKAPALRRPLQIQNQRQSNRNGWPVRSNRTHRYYVKDDSSNAAIFAHSQEWLCHEKGSGVVTAGGSRTAPTDALGAPSKEQSRRDAGATKAGSRLDVNAGA